MKPSPNFDLLNANGLNMQAVFNLSDLPETIRTGLLEQTEIVSSFRQLILIGHGGRGMWEAVQASEFRENSDPIDSFSIDRVERWFAGQVPAADYEIIYPASKCIVPLQSLGRLAGWHHTSPFRIGINQAWGSWFAYRVAALADTDFAPTDRMQLASPCDSCVDKPCVSACPAGLLACGDFSLKGCIDYRLVSESSCKARCLARLACPVASEHRYSTEQINYHYGRSMKTIEEYYR
ncbi:hypothetical protein Ga0123461_0660 [Mariprofundus aestuarium]|uniref:4Fe-4S ferredoxin-type domain-containing protein n=1 Tax=Mariprofundus aestuarium TaxID=1921086 RepID=A0A2K8L4C5_MARES|nr:hypothetical protein [Mariprofundus aestuarium]ATX79086.1 hypothetical protein Ga0123461_0660 [Mariprofundus aestuarium]